MMVIGFPGVPELLTVTTAPKAVRIGNLAFIVVTSVHHDYRIARLRRGSAARDVAEGRGLGPRIGVAAVRRYVISGGVGYPNAECQSQNCACEKG